MRGGCCGATGRGGGGTTAGERARRAHVRVRHCGRVRKWARDDMAAATAAARPHAYRILARSHRQRMPGSAGQSQRRAVGDEDDVEKKMVKEGGMR